MCVYQDILFYKVHTQIYLHTYSQQKHLTNSPEFVKTLKTSGKLSKWFRKVTPPKFNIAPKNRPSQKGNDRLPTIIFQGLAVKFWGCTLLVTKPIPPLLEKTLATLTWVDDFHVFLLPGPIGSMGLVYFLTIYHKFMPNVGKYPSPMDPMGPGRRVFFWAQPTQPLRRLSASPRYRMELNSWPKPVESILLLRLRVGGFRVVTKTT